MTASKMLQEKRIQEQIINLEMAKKIFNNLNKNILRINERSIQLNKLKLLLIKKDYKTFFPSLIKIINILLFFPEVIFIGLKKLIFGRDSRLF